jgi:hypothetical protein
MVRALFIVPALFGLLYVAWPLWSAYELRQAILDRDTATLERKVDWPAVRASLKGSLKNRGQPAAEEAAPEPSSSVWSRITSMVRPQLTETLIDRHVTAEGLPQLYSYRRTYWESVRPRLGLGGPETRLAGTWLSGTAIDRAWSSLRRLERAEFKSPTRLELEILDPYRADRHYLTLWELKGFDWKLVSLAIAPPR